ncbi:hypothetical protein [Plantibacter sp. ME-Dv--P-095]|uniref:hypothetical protein n=1 Tax=Plantibacter sp. ME-Dv--P-095 TaxID=3040299 RepID=UPI00254F7FEB|nr:hypothetical protein [Plantibacter sp. ME-Dv--P-095]
MGLIGELAVTESPIEEADRRIAEQVTDLVARIGAHRAERVVELARLACLPWGIGGQIKPDTQAGPATAELIALIALTVDEAEVDGSATDETPNSLYNEAHQWADAARSLVELCQARELIVLSGRPRGDLDSIAFSARSANVWMRNSSYSDMVKVTQDALFGHGGTTTALIKRLGFDASDAYVVLTGLHDLQIERMNDRLGECFRALDYAHAADVTRDDLEEAQRVRSAVNIGWQPTANLVAVSPAELAVYTGLASDVVDSVLEVFSVDVGQAGARDILVGFVAGDNPLRTNPVIRTRRNEYMLVHDALTLPAIRENLEQRLKGLPEWEPYQHWRGELLESLGRAALEPMLPGATTYAGFHYFVPSDEAEAQGAAAGYTKKVEGDLLLILDDVAIIVEAKAVAVTPATRSGETRKLRQNLTGIISVAAEQAARLQVRIEDDGGVRFHDGGWLDLSQIREIHTVALTLDDLSGVATATSDLVAAGLLDDRHIPWVVSIHDLQVIATLVARPAEFLLYLRRRRDPEVSLAFAAADELDLFLYFFEAGLFVEPDPQKVAAELPYVKAPSPGELRRRASQARVYISSRTDPLDAWHYAQIDDSLPRVPRPTRSESPMNQLVDEIQVRRFHAWLSIGATLLSGSTKAQRSWQQMPRDLFARTSGDGRQRTQAVPVGSTLSESWLLVWTTRPIQRDVDEIARTTRAYLRAKKYQMSLTRGVAFVFDEVSRALADVIYDGAPPTPNAELDRMVETLFPIQKMAAPLPPKAKGITSTQAKKKRRRR